MFGDGNAADGTPPSAETMARLLRRVEAARRLLTRRCARLQRELEKAGHD